MHGILIGAVVTLLTAVPALSADANWYSVGDEVTYGQLVDNPDVKIRFIGYQARRAILSLTGLDSDPERPPKIDLKLNEPIDVFVKKDCSSVCKNFYVTLTWSNTLGPNSIRIEYEVKIIAGRAS